MAGNPADPTLNAKMGLDASEALRELQNVEQAGVGAFNKMTNASDSLVDNMNRMTDALKKYHALTEAKSGTVARSWIGEFNKITAASAAMGSQVGGNVARIASLANNTVRPLVAVGVAMTGVGEAAASSAAALLLLPAFFAAAIAAAKMYVDYIYKIVQNQDELYKVLINASSEMDARVQTAVAQLNSWHAISENLRLDGEALAIVYGGKLADGLVTLQNLWENQGDLLQMVHTASAPVIENIQRLSNLYYENATMLPRWMASTTAGKVVIEGFKLLLDATITSLRGIVLLMGYAWEATKKLAGMFFEFVTNYSTLSKLDKNRMPGWLATYVSFLDVVSGKTYSDTLGQLSEDYKKFQEDMASSKEEDVIFGTGPVLSEADEKEYKRRAEAREAKEKAAREAAARARAAAIEANKRAHEAFEDQVKSLDASLLKTAELYQNQSEKTAKDVLAIKNAWIAVDDQTKTSGQKIADALQRAGEKEAANLKLREAYSKAVADFNAKASKLKEFEISSEKELKALSGDSLEKIKEKTEQIKARKKTLEEETEAAKKLADIFGQQLSAMDLTSGLAKAIEGIDTSTLTLRAMKKVQELRKQMESAQTPEEKQDIIDELGKTVKEGQIKSVAQMFNEHFFKTDEMDAFAKRKFQNIGKGIATANQIISDQIANSILPVLDNAIQVHTDKLEELKAKEESIAENITNNRIKMHGALTQAAIDEYKKKSELMRQNLRETRLAKEGERQEALKAWRTEKDFRESQAIMAGAGAVLNGLNTAPAFVGIALAASAAAISATQIGIITAEKPPQFHKGGILQPDEQVITGRKGEAVLSQGAVAELGEETVKDLNGGKQGGGKPLHATINVVLDGRQIAKHIVKTTTYAANNKRLGMRDMSGR